MRVSLVLNCISKLPKSYSNFPERYVRRQTEFIEWKPPNLPQYRRKVIRWRKRAYYDMHRPWTEEFQMQNAPNVPQKHIYVEPIKEWYIFRGDRVEILTGKDTGKQGLVNYIVKQRNWITVEGLNCQYVMQNKTEDFPGFMMKIERPLLIPRDAALVDPTDQKPTVIEWRYDDQGNYVRVSRRSGRIIPIPSVAMETIDFKEKQLYVEQPKDTTANDVKSSTFVPKIMTFEMEIMEQMGIKEERVPYPMYWY